MKKYLKSLIFFCVTLVFFLGLSLLTNYYEWASPLFTICLFPFSILSLTFKHYCLSLNDTHFSLPINDEITQGLLFLLFIIGQALVYYWLYNKCATFVKEFRKKKERE